MEINCYSNIDYFCKDVMPILLEDEVCNNLPISIINSPPPGDASGWHMSAVINSSRSPLLVALCTKPFNLLLCASKEASTNEICDAMQMLTAELRRQGFKPPGVFAEASLADCFAEAYVSGTACAEGDKGNGFKSLLSRFSSGKPFVTYKRQMIVMAVEQLSPYERPPGACRALTTDDLAFVPLWEHDFCKECKLPTQPPSEIAHRIGTRIGMDSHFIWEDGEPVSQAVYGRQTPNGAVVNWVYTPPQHRGRGYATAVVGELTASLLSRGKRFCCLFADADNQTSRSIYSRLGYRDICTLTEYHFS